MIYSHVESFHNKSWFCFNFKQFWIVQNLFPTIAKLLSISVHFILLFHINLLNGIHESSWIFRIISILDIWTSWKKKFTQQSLKHSVSFLIKICFFAIGNLIFKRDIGAPMGIDLVPFWEKFFFISSNRIVLKT